MESVPAATAAASAVAVAEVAVASDAYVAGIEHVVPVDAEAKAGVEAVGRWAAAVLVMINALFTKSEGTITGSR